MATQAESSRLQRLELELLMRDARIRDLEARLFVCEAALERMGGDGK